MSQLKENLNVLTEAMSGCEHLDHALANLRRTIDVSKDGLDSKDIEACTAEIEGLRVTLARSIDTIAKRSLALISESHARRVKKLL